MRVLLTGVAGFIGFHCAERLLAAGADVLGIDNLNDYYDPALKHARLERLQGSPGFRFLELDCADRAAMARLFAQETVDRVLHLAAQAGVRHSIEHPEAYVDANLVGFLAVLEGCRQARVEHLVYASSSSVYGLNTRIPFSVAHNVDHPVSLYAATKKANELMAHSYSHLYGLPTTGLRFFTVYGPWGRPDMALFRFTRAVLAGEPITVYNHGRMQRDFTYIDDIVEAVVRVCDAPPGPDPGWDAATGDPARSAAPYRVYNIGNNQPVGLDRFIAAIEAATGRTAEQQLLPMQPGDVPVTAAEVDDLQQAVGFRPDTPIETGVQRFVEWYRAYYGV
ncbi:MAG: NAD-dependent epimerase [Planctomycetota bacterium]